MYRTLRTEQRASLLGATTLLGAPGLTTRNNKATSSIIGHSAESGVTNGDKGDARRFSREILS